jgi:hypothetical protein
MAAGGAAVLAKAVLSGELGIIFDGPSSAADWTEV